MITRFDHGCCAMRSIRLALAVSIQCRSSITSTAGPFATAAATRSKTAAATSSPARPPSTMPATASSGRPIEPGWAMTAMLATCAGSDVTSSRTSRDLPMPGLARHECHGGLLRGHHVGGVDDAGQPGVGAGAPDHHRTHPDATAEHGVDARGSAHPPTPRSSRRAVRRRTGRVRRRCRRDCPAARRRERPTPWCGRGPPANGRSTVAGRTIGRGGRRGGRRRGAGDGERQSSRRIWAATGDSWGCIGPSSGTQGVGRIG